MNLPTPAFEPPLIQPKQASQPPGPSATHLLRDQHVLIADLKSNFEKEMGELKNQMAGQQQMFKDQIDKMVGEQGVARQRREDAEQELQHLKRELEAKKESDRRQQELLQIA